MIEKGEFGSSKKTVLQGNDGCETWPRNKRVMVPECGNKILNTRETRIRDGLKRRNCKNGV